MFTTDKTIAIPAEFLNGRDPAEFAVLTVNSDNLYPLYHADDILLVHKTSVPHAGAAIVLISDRWYIGTVDDGCFTPLDHALPPISDFYMVGVPVMLLRRFQ